MKAFKPKLCSICHTVLVYDSHDILKGYVCAQCERRKSYSTPNQIGKGKPCKLPSFSLEFEIAAPMHEARRALILLQYQFQRTYDSTVSDEYKSPIYHSIRAFRKPLVVLDDLRDLVNELCGTHLHVSFQYRSILYPIRQAVFGPLITHLTEQREQTIAFWGRTFCSQARSTLEENERHVCFNTLSRHPTLEYRLPRFRSALQYLAVVKFCRQTTSLLNYQLASQESPQRQVKPMEPEQLGDLILTRYKKAQRAFEQNRLILPDALTQDERIVTCADLY